MSDKTAEQEIRDTTENWAEAIRAKDYDKLMGHYAEDVVVFDVPPPLRKQGKDVYRQSWEGWLGQFQGDVYCEFKDMEISASDNIAFLHTLTKIGTIGADDTDTGSWVRVTVGFEKRDGRWLAVHEHASIPAGM